MQATTAAGELNCEVKSVRIEAWTAVRCSAPQCGLAVQGVSKAEPRSDASIPVRRQRTGILPARAAAREYQGAQTPVGAGVWHARIEIAEDVVAVDRRQVNLIPEAEV